MAATVSAPAAIGRPQGNFQVDPAGQASYRFPIQVPPGIAGCQPQLELVYSHRQRVGLLGVGWSLSGLSSITRTKATYAVDGFNGCIGFDARDRFSLDGQRLIAVRGDYGAPNTLYFTEVQSWKHVLAGASPLDGFVVTQKSGETWEYGTTADSRVLNADGSAVRLWALRAITDRNGNRVEYGYNPQPLLADGTRGAADPGSSYIDRIGYTTGPGLAATRFVQFVYEHRDDPTAEFIGGSPVINCYRLKQIATSVIGQTEARGYTLSYGTGVATQLSRLESIVETGAGGAALPPHIFTWQDIEAPGFEAGPVSHLDQHLAGADVRAASISGRGLTDVVQLWTDNSGVLNATTYLATPSQDGIIYPRSSNSVLDSFPAEREVYIADVDGDGRADLLIAYRSSRQTLKLAVCRSNGSGFDTPVNFDTGDTWNTATHLAFFAADVNGDGRTDFVEAYSHYDPNLGSLLYFRSYLSMFGDAPGATFTSAVVSKTDDPAAPPNVLAIWPMDVNGDGMMDLVRTWQRGSDSHVVATAYISVSDGLYDVAFDKRAPVVSDLGILALPNQIAFLPTDVNGDGVQDLLQVWQEPNPQGTRLHLTTFLCNAAGGFVDGVDAIFDDQVVQQRAFDMMDFNGGGMTALVSKWIDGNNELNFSAFLASPSGRYRPGPTFQAGMVGSNFNLASLHPADANGDGKGDLLRIGAGQQGETTLLPYLSAGAYPDMVSTFQNALGAQTAVTYKPLSDPTVYDAGDAQTFPAASARRFPSRLTPTVFPAEGVLGQAVYVVSDYAESNDSAINRFALGGDFSVRYAGARINLLGRGWQGFGSVTLLDKSNGRKTVQAYNLDFPYTGTLASTRVEADGAYATDPRVPKDQTGVLMTLATSQYEVVDRSGPSTAAGKVVEVLRTQMRVDHYDYGESNFDYALASTYDYDDYGNVATHSYLGYVDPQTGKPLDPAEVVYHRNVYQNDVRADGWALGFLRYAKVTANADEADPTRFLPGDYKLEQRTYAPTTTNLASKGDWDDVYGVYLTFGYDYDRFGNRTSETKPGGFVTRYEFDPDYNTFPMRTISPTPDNGVPIVIAYGYDPRFGVRIAVQDPNGFVSITGLDAFGRVASRQGPLPTPQTASDPNAVASVVTGDAGLRQALLSALVVTIETRDYVAAGGSQFTASRALQRFSTDATRDFIWQQSYVDGRSRERELLVQSGQGAGEIAILTDYDGSDAVVRKSLPIFTKTPVIGTAPLAVTVSYDVLGRPLKRSIPAGADGTQSSDTIWFYGTGGAVTETAAAGAAEAYIRVLEHHQYDGHDKVRKVVLPGDGNATTVFEFDPIGRLKKATDPATPTSPQGVATSITYGSTDRRLTIDDPDQNTTGDPNVKAQTYEYDAVTGRLLRQTDAAAQATTYEYDNLGRVTTKHLGDGRTVVYAYDHAAVNGRGRVTHVATKAASGDAESSFDFGYDAYGNTSTTTLAVAGEAGDFVTRASFDPQARMVREVQPDSSELLRQYAFGRLVNQTLDGARMDYPLENYAATGKAGTVIAGQGILPGAGVVAEYTFNPGGQLYGETVTGSAGAVVDASYGYDLLAQLLAITDTVGGDQSFGYQNRRLKTAAVPGFDAAAYQYDASGNITTKDGIDYTCRAHFPVSGSGAGGIQYTAEPDACGRTRTRSSGGKQLAFDYDGFGRLRRVRSGSGDTIRDIVSDYRGRRLRQSNADGTQTIFVSATYHVTRRGSGVASVTKYLVDARGVAAAISTGQDARILYLRPDHKGSTTHTFGADGVVASRIVYGGFGEPQLLSGPDDFAPRYERRGWDVEIGLYYFGARYYDPATGRFLTPDDQIGGVDVQQADVLNRYAFELNNPVNLVDPNGHLADWEWGLIIGLVLVATAVIIIASGGAATPLAAAGVGALLGAGLNASIYSATHTSQSGGQFWGGWAADVAIGAVVGAVSGAAFAGLGSLAESATANVASRVGQFAARAAIYGIGGAAISGTGDASNQFMSNVIDKTINGKDVSLDDGVLRAFITGAIGGAIAGVGQAGIEARLLRQLLVAREAEEEGLEMTEFAGARADEGALLPGGRAQGNYGAIPPQQPAAQPLRYFQKWPDTFTSRIFLFGVGESTAVTDAILEAEGY